MNLHGFCELLICACTPDRVRCVTSISGVPVWVVEAWCPCKSSVVIIFYCKLHCKFTGFLFLSLLGCSTGKLPLKFYFNFPIFNF